MKAIAVTAGIVALLASLSAQAPALESSATAASSLPRLKSLLVSHQGQIVLERYFNGARATTPANIKSAAKSVIAALVGIAVAKGHIKTIDQQIVEYFPELAGDPDKRKRGITIEDLLTMRSGLESTSGRNYGAWVVSPNWVRFVLRRRLIDEPGTRVEYRPAARTCCRRSSRKRRRRAPGSLRRRSWRSRSASRWRSGRPIRRASISAATRC